MIVIVNALYGSLTAPEFASTLIPLKFSQNIALSAQSKIDLH